MRIIDKTNGLELRKKLVYLHHGDSLRALPPTIFLKIVLFSTIKVVKACPGSSYPKVLLYHKDVPSNRFDESLVPRSLIKSAKYNALTCELQQQPTEKQANKSL